MYLPIANRGLTQPLSAIPRRGERRWRQLYQHDGPQRALTDPQASWLTLFAKSDQDGEPGHGWALGAKFPGATMATKTGDHQQALRTPGLPGWTTMNW